MHKLAPFAVTLLLSSLSAQGSFVVPSKLASASGNHYDFYVFDYAAAPVQPVRVQLVYSTSDISVRAALLKGINFRRTNAIANVNPPGTANLTIDLSMGPNSAANAVNVFASNLGSATTAVFGGNVVLPPAPYSGPNPAAFVVTIPFTTPFAYLPPQGNGLVADLKIGVYTPVGTSASWYLDSHRFEGGVRAENGGPQSRCLFSNNKYNSGIGYPTFRYPGSNWNVTYSNLLPNAPGVGALGNVGVGQSWGGIPLPVDLTPLGAPNCSWNTNMLVVVGLLANASGSASWPNIPIPNDPALVDAAFYDHAAFVDLAANAAGVVTTWSSKWTIGSGNYPEGTKIYRLADTAGNPSGTLVRESVVAEFVY